MYVNICIANEYLSYHVAIIYPAERNLGFSLTIRPCDGQLPLVRAGIRTKRTRVLFRMVLYH